MESFVVAICRLTLVNELHDVHYVCQSSFQKYLFHILHFNDL